MARGYRCWTTCAATDYGHSVLAAPHDPGGQVAKAALLDSLGDLCFHTLMAVVHEFY